MKRAFLRDSAGWTEESVTERPGERFQSRQSAGRFRICVIILVIDACRLGGTSISFR